MIYFSRLLRCCATIFDNKGFDYFDTTFSIVNIFSSLL